MRIGSKWDSFSLEEQYTITPKDKGQRTDSERASLYSYARSRKLFVKAFIDGDNLVFKLSATPVIDLKGQPPRGSKSHRKTLADGV